MVPYHPSPPVEPQQPATSGLGPEQGRKRKAGRLQKIFSAIHLLQSGFPASGETVAEDAGKDVVC